MKASVLHAPLWPFGFLGLSGQHSRWLLALKACGLVARGMGRKAISSSSAAFLSCFGPATVGPREMTLSVCAFTRRRFVSVWGFFWPLDCSCCGATVMGRWRRRSVPSRAIAGAPSSARGLVAPRLASRSGASPRAVKARGKTGSK